MISKEKKKYIKMLHSKKARQQEKVFLVEGGKSLQELLQSDFEILYLYISEKFCDIYGNLLDSKDYVLCPEDQIQNVSTLQSNDMGIAIVKQKTFTLDDIDTSKYCLVLDTINDPGNMGTILRIADWYGIEQVVCSYETVEFYNPKVIISTMGSFARIKVISTELQSYLSQTRLPVYGAYLEGESIHKKSFAPAGNIIIGNESHGISPELEPYITDKITIPRFGQAESLNAGVATGIILDNIIKTIC